MAKRRRGFFLQIVDNAEAPLQPQTRPTLLAAALGLVSMDIFSPQASDCNVHLGLAQRILQMTEDGYFWAAHPLANEIFHCYDVVAKTARNTIGTPRNNESGSPYRRNGAQLGLQIAVKEDALLKSHSFILDTAFGISKETMELLSQMTHAAMVCRTAELPAASLHSMISDLAIRICDIMEQATISQITRTRSEQQLAQLTGLGRMDLPYSHTRLPRVVNDELWGNHQRAFHYALML